MADHAILSPSGASRWLSCTPSARLEQQFPDRAGQAAAEGTLAHTLGELLIKRRVREIAEPEYLRLLSDIQADPLYEPAMLEHCENYAVYVMEQYNAAQVHTRDAVMLLEQRLNLTDYVPEGFGTGDCIIIADHVLDMIDLKYGKGVPVSAHENKQMMLYALGALREFDHLYDIATVRMTIYQPRLDNVSVYEMPVEELRRWAAEYLVPRARMAFAGQGEFAPGDACRFCKAKAVCKAHAQYHLQLARHEFKSPELLTDDEVADILARADNFTKWINAVSDHALHEAFTNGKKWPGYKLVEGRSNRAYTDREKIFTGLVAGGYKPEEITKPAELLTLTALEKTVLKADFNTYVAPYVVKPQGKPTLVPATDKRPELNTAEAAAADFAGADIED